MTTDKIKEFLELGIKIEKLKQEIIEKIEKCKKIRAKVFGGSLNFEIEEVTCVEKDYVYFTEYYNGAGESESDCIKIEVLLLETEKEIEEFYKIEKDKLDKEREEFKKNKQEQKEIQERKLYETLKQRFEK